MGGRSRSGYSFVDRILEIRPGGGGGRRPGGRGIKAVSRWDPFVRPGPCGEAELSPCFAAEAVGQLAAWVAMSACDWRRRPVAGLTAEALAGPSARPGDLVLLEVEVESLEEDAVHYHGRASVAGVPILTLRDAVGPMLPMEDFDDPAEVAREFRSLFRPASPAEGAEAGGAGAPRPAGPDLRPGPGRGLRAEDHPAIDAILERDDRRVLAATCVSRNASYLSGHFPRSPVLPATLLLDGLVGLAAWLAAPEEEGRPPAPVRAARLADLKMRDFVRPGSRLLSEVRLRDRSGDRTVVDLSARLPGRSVLTGVVELVRGKAGGG